LHNTQFILRSENSAFLVGSDNEEVSVVLVADNNEYVSLYLPVPKSKPL